MKIIDLDEFVDLYNRAVTPAIKEKGILAAFGSLTLVFHNSYMPGNERHVVDLSAKDIERIVQNLGETQT